MRLRVVLVCCALSLVVAGSASAATLPFAASSGALSLLLENRTASKTATVATQKTTVTMAAAAAITPAPAFTSTELSTTPGANWLTNGGDVSNARYSSLNQINTSNVANLKEAWHIHLDGSGMASKYSAEATPLVYNGVMYIPTGNSDVFAVDAATGARLWTYHSNINQTVNTACCGWDNRGVAIGDGKIYVAQLDGRLVALDQRTGAVIWKIVVHNWREGYTLTAAPLYYNGLVYVGSTGGEFMSRGSVSAYHASDGSPAFRFFTAPAPGDIGGQTWPAGPLGFSTGGATVWHTPAVDPALNMIVVSTGNAAPWTGRGPGQNLFTSSMVAIDATTGQVRWWYQMVHHDLWDYDCPNAPIMFDVTIAGINRHAIGEACKTGWLYLLDRTNGLPLIGIKETKVPQLKALNTWPTQPVPIGDRITPQTCAKKSTYTKPFAGKPVKIGCLWDPPRFDQAVAIAPSAQGGVDWNPSAYNPNTHLFYVCAADSDMAIQAIPAAQLNANYLAGKGQAGVNFAGIKFWQGYITAMDVTTNKVAWRVKWPRTCYSGTFTTAGGLVFAGRGTGEFDAYDAANGSLLWKAQLASNVAAPGMTYSVNGKQYVALYDGGTAFTFESPGKHGDDLYAFALP
jgi:quinohemoprotein ethanol dehydrogenase